MLSEPVSRNRAGHVLDLTVRPGRRDVAQSILGGDGPAIRAGGCARRGIPISRVAPSSRAKDVWRLGFLPYNRRRHTLLGKFADSGLHEATLIYANWSYTIGDGEARFSIIQALGQTLVNEDQPVRSEIGRRL